MRRPGRVTTVAGAIIIVVVLVLMPVGVLLAGAIASAVLGTALTRDAAVRHAGSELLDLNR
ncbi:MAG: hypothetical protein QOD72_2731 [Acidimicrobiaceae bacterium]|nr:hypothetical protein [Acidimicrobiaceae bacterium]